MNGWKTQREIELISYMPGVFGLSAYLKSEPAFSYKGYIYNDGMVITRIKQFQCSSYKS